MSEDELQSIWSAHPLAGSTVKSRCGKTVRVIDPGTLNVTDGPDFLNAQIQLDGVPCFGAIELHLRSSGWRAHRHDQDASFDQVVLHVALSSSKSKVKRTDGSSVPEVVLDEYMSDMELRRFLSSSGSNEKMKCPVPARFISHQAFLKQLEKARLDYFRTKTDDFFKYYDPDLGLQAAWKKALIISLFDGMGIPHNRELCRKAARIVWDRISELSHPPTQPEIARMLEVFKSWNWNNKSVYRSTHPHRILPQMIFLADRINRYSFQKVLKAGTIECWSEWMSDVGFRNYYKTKVLAATVFLPALYAAGTLTMNTRLLKYSFEQWKEYQVLLPRSIRKQLRFLPEESFNEASTQLAATHHLRAWCKPQRCTECEVLKSAFAS